MFTKSLFSKHPEKICLPKCLVKKKFFSKKNLLKLKSELFKEKNLKKKVEKKNMLAGVRQNGHHIYIPSLPPNPYPTVHILHEACSVTQSQGWEINGVCKNASMFLAYLRFFLQIFSVINWRLRVQKWI